jgi:hypothetical protein
MSSENLNKKKTFRNLFDLYWKTLYSCVEINDYNQAVNMLHYLDEIISEMWEEGEKDGAAIAISRQRRRAIKTRIKKAKGANGQYPQKPLC